MNYEQMIQFSRRNHLENDNQIKSYSNYDHYTTMTLEEKIKYVKNITPSIPTEMKKRLVLAFSKYYIKKVFNSSY